MTITRKQKWEEKQLYGRFKRLINNISHEKTWMLLRKGNFKRETKSLLIAAHNNAIRTNQIKGRIDKMQQNSKCRLCVDGDETINHIISECSKLAQKEYKTRHEWMDMVIHWEMCQKFKFDHTNKWYMHSPAYVLENDIHKLVWDFDIQTDHLISARRPDLIIINNNKKKRICKVMDFAVLADYRIKLKECEKKDKYLDLARELKKTLVHEGDNYTNYDWCFWYSNKRFIKGTGRLGSWRTSGDHPNYSVIGKDQNTEKSPGDLRRLAVTGAVKNHQLKLMWKTLKE